MNSVDILIRKKYLTSICIFLGGFIFFLAIVWLHRNESLIWLDEGIAKFVALIRGERLTVAFRIITFFASVTFIVITDLLITIIGIWGKYNGRDLLIFNLSNIGGVIFMQVLKVIFGRERPPMPWLATAGGYSFPSGHTLMATIYYGLLLYLLIRSGRVATGRKRLIACLGLLPALIGLSRIYLGVHYASDVLAGWTVGLAWLGMWMIIRDSGTY